MDFRSIDPASIEWKTHAKFGPRPVAKVRVRTPVCRARVGAPTGGRQGVEMAPPAAFLEFLEAVDDRAAESAVVAEWASGLAHSRTIYRGTTFHVSVFSDTEAFDATTNEPSVGRLHHAYAASCILELQGCWSTAQKWGVRWRVAQIKFCVRDGTEDSDSDDPFEPKQRPRPEKKKQSECAFLEDDDD